MDSKKLTIVIVSFKSEAKIINCLNSISDPVNIIVVENSNNYNFKKNLEEKFTNLKCILTGSNLGYAVANNIGLNQVKTKYALILNPDTLLNDHAIKNFLNRAEKQKDFWLMGPGNDQMVELEFNNNSLIEVNNLKGFAIFLNLAKFNNTFFDENFFLYFEEIDLCKRLQNNNIKIFIDPSIEVSHFGGASHNTEINKPMELSRNWHWMWSSFYYHKKHHGYIAALVRIFPKLITSSIKFIVYLLIFKRFKSDIYKHRVLGIINSVLLKKSWYRPKI